MKKGLCVLLAAVLFIESGEMVGQCSKKAAAKESEIAINYSVLNLAVGRSKTVKVKNLPQNAKVTWKMKNKKIAVVKKGRVTAKKTGHTKLTAKITYKNGKKRVVNRLSTRVIVSAPEVSTGYDGAVHIGIGRSKKIKINNRPVGARVSCEPEDSTIAEVKKDVITGRREGETKAVVKVTYKEGKKKVTRKLSTVVKIVGPSLSVETPFYDSTNRFQVIEGKTMETVVRLLPPGAVTTWKMEHPEFAAIQESSDEKAVILGRQDGDTKVIAEITYQENGQTVTKTLEKPLEVLGSVPEKGVRIKKTKETLMLPYADEYADKMYLYEEGDEEVPVTPEFSFYLRTGTDNDLDKSSVHVSDEKVAGSLSLYGMARNDSESLNMLLNDWELELKKLFREYYIDGYAKHPGTTDISFKDKYGQNYQVTLEVLPYQNPIKSFRIQNIRGGENLAKYTEKKAWYNGGSDDLYYHFKTDGLFFEKKTKKPEIEIKVKEGWVIRYIYSYVDGYSVAEYADGFRIDDEEINEVSKTITLGKTCKKGNDVEVGVYLKNTKTGVSCRVRFGYDSYAHSSGV